MRYAFRSFLLFACLLSIACRENVNHASHTPSGKKENSTIQTVNYEHIFGDDRPFPQCHASTMINLGDSNFLLAWFGGKHEKDDDVAIWMADGKPGQWSKPREVAKINNEPHWNPVLFNGGDTLFLFFKTGKDTDNWITWVQTSTDQGKTWTPAHQLVQNAIGGRGPVRNQPIILADGSWLAPASIEKNEVWNAFTDRSVDHGKTWTASDTLAIDRKIIVGEGLIQPALWESSPGNVHMLIRSSAGSICRSDSKDSGKTWSPAYKTSLPNNNSGIDVAQIAGDTIAVIYNPVNKNWGDRFPMSIAVSTDNGKSWPYHFDIEKGSGDAELSYPDMFYKDGYLFACYTWNRQSIAFWKGKISFN